MRICSVFAGSGLARDKPGGSIVSSQDGLGPPFEEGNAVAVSHGAYSDRLVDPEAEALLVRVLEHNPHLTAQDIPAAMDYAITLARAWRLESWLTRVGDLDSKGRVRPGVETVRKWLERAERARARLGLDPVSRASLRVDSVHAEREARALQRDELATGRRLRLAAEQRLELVEGEAEEVAGDA